MATTFSPVHSLQLALPLPPTPITAIFNFLEGEQLNKFGIITAPAVMAVADRKKILLEIEFILKRLSGLDNACEYKRNYFFIPIFLILFQIRTESAFLNMNVAFAEMLI